MVAGLRSRDEALIVVDMVKMPASCLERYCGAGGASRPLTGAGSAGRLTEAPQPSLRVKPELAIVLVAKDLLEHRHGSVIGELTSQHDDGHTAHPHVLVHLGAFDQEGNHVNGAAYILLAVFAGHRMHRPEPDLEVWVPNERHQVAQRVRIRHLIEADGTPVRDLPVVAGQAFPDRGKSRGAEGDQRPMRLELTFGSAEGTDQTWGVRYQRLLP